MDSYSRHLSCISGRLSLLWHGSMSLPDTVPVLRPRLPPAERLLPWLERIDTSRIYSNHGPLAALFRTGLGEHFGVDASNVVLASSGTTALTMALLALDLPRPSACAVPAWTFPACAHAVLAAGMEPVLLDVCRENWTITPEAVLEAARERGGTQAPLRAAMPVRAFGRPLDSTPWQALQDKHGIAVIIDAASGFDCIHAEQIPQVVSLHATKCFGIGEGGLILCRDADFCRTAECSGNFGYFGTRCAERIAINGKLSEYHAAVGLAALEEWPARRIRQYEVAQAIRHAMGPLGKIRLLPGWGEHWITTTCLTDVDQDSVQALEESMNRANIETRRWWPLPLPEQPAFAQFSGSDTPIARLLSHSTIGLPFAEDLSGHAMQRIAEAAQLAIHEMTACGDMLHA